MLVLIHKECGGPALEESPVGEVCAIPVDRFPFPCFTCLEEIVVSPMSSRLRTTASWVLRSAKQ
ncbi:MAG: hypothetical protein LV473_15235 [Nitrospira sp.]|nr:hypothetical protein [Nitrospira sp.]